MLDVLKKFDVINLAKSKMRLSAFNAVVFYQHNRTVNDTSLASESVDDKT